MKPIQVLIVDDSALVRKILQDVLSSDPAINVVGTAPDPYIAIRKIKSLKPDVLTLDIEMPRMDGLTFLSKLMKVNPMPVIMFSTLTDAGADSTMKALALGAVDFVAKPKVRQTQEIEVLREELTAKVKAAAGARIRRPAPQASVEVPPKLGMDAVLKSHPDTPIRQGEPVLVVGASTGGTVAIEQILCRLPGDMPPTLIVQHMPPVFTRSFANRVNDMSQMTVREAADGDRLVRGEALIAPGGQHMIVNRDMKGYYVSIKDAPPVNRHKPSVDVLFRSAANTLGSNAIGVILTGMGDDGARGMREMHDRGAHTVAQDEETSVVFGMPKVAIEMQGVDHTLPLQGIADYLLKHLRQ